MIDVNTIKNVLKSKSRGPHTRLEDVVAYEGKYGIGVRIPVKILLKSVLKTVKIAVCMYKFDWNSFGIIVKVLSCQNICIIS
jgi:hypothetical protein